VKQRKQFLEKVENRLLQRRAEMAKALLNLSNEKISDGQVLDSGDEALSLSMEKLQTSLEQTEINELKSIDDALNRLKKGEYGICVDCGKPISDVRLENSPYVARCIVCQEDFEKK